MKNFLLRLFADESGQAVVEYALLLALVSLAVIMPLGMLGDELDDLFREIVRVLRQAY